MSWAETGMKLVALCASNCYRFAGHSSPITVMSLLIRMLHKVITVAQLVFVGDLLKHALIITQNVVVTLQPLITGANKQKQLHASAYSK